MRGKERHEKKRKTREEVDRVDRKMGREKT